MAKTAWFEFQGLNELIADLQHLPAELKGEATSIVMDAATAARDDIVSQYPQGPTGNLKKGVKVLVKNIGPHGVAVQVRSSAPHAWLWEHGRCRWGEISDPPAPVFIPAMLRHRRAMYTQLAALMERHGLTVTAA